jgi:hypothetical protein
MSPFAVFCCVFALVVPVRADSSSRFPAAGVPDTVISAADSLRAHRAAQSAVRTYGRRVTPGNAHALRHELILRLDELGRVIPGDDWIMGQHVGLLAEHGVPTAAVAAALRCQGTPWWCHALAGFALHVEGSIAAASAAFDAALAAKPESIRCAWAAELAHALEGDLRGDYGGADCHAKQRLEPRIWWLADPLHSVAGNARRTEHYARLVAMHLHHAVLALTGARCADTHHQSVLRAGWPDWWWSAAGELETAGAGYRFMPAGERWQRPLESAAWPLELESGPAAERYLPHYGTFMPLEHQTAFFARGDSLLVVAAARFGSARAGGLALSRDEHEPPFVAALDAAASGPLRLHVQRDAYLVSVDAVRPAGTAARARFGHRLPATSGVLAVSDLLLFAWADGVLEELDAVLPLMFDTTRFPRFRTVGIYWEVYGADDASGVDVSLSAIPEEGGALRRLGEGLRLVAARDRVAVQWREPSEPAGVLTKHLLLDLSQLPPGRFVIRLEVRSDDGESVVAQRAIEIT